MQFDKEIFLRDYEGRAGLNPLQRPGLETLLDQIMADVEFTRIREIAYLLATVKGETGFFQPVREKRANPQRQPDLFKLQQRYFPSGFFGRGYVQLTFEDNYRNAGVKLTGKTVALDSCCGPPRAITIGPETFVKEPNLVLQPGVSYLILARGMREGWFRSRPNGARFKLSDFIKDGQPPDYVNARNIINGDVKKNGGKFAGFANEFELALRASVIE